MLDKVFRPEDSKFFDALWANNLLSEWLFSEFFLREWSALSPDQAEYLVQVRGPHDMFQYIVRDLVTITNVSNAAILFDESFHMSDEHYTDLLIHLPVRHVINEVDFRVWLFIIDITYKYLY